MLDVCALVSSEIERRGKSFWIHLCGSSLNAVATELPSTGLEIYANKFHKAAQYADLSSEVRVFTANPDVKVVNEPFMPLGYLVYQLEYDSVHGQFNGTIAMSEEDGNDFLMSKLVRVHVVGQRSSVRHLLRHCEVHDFNVLRFEPSRVRFHKWYDHVHPTPVSIGIYRRNSLEWRCCVLTRQTRSHKTSDS